MEQNNKSTQTLVHWADITADRIIKQCKNLDGSEKDSYTVASGITPSGVVHFGNFREVITVDFVARALRNRGKKVRFIFSWDDYDTFRKIPANLPKQDELKEYLFMPIVDTPDPFEEYESYAVHHEKKFEAELSKMGVTFEPIYQSQKYRAGIYKDQIIHTLKNRDKIVEILNRHRSTALDASWQPVSIYCEKYKTDKVKNIKYDGSHTLTYEHAEHDYQGTVDINTTKNVKLPWRVDWPMRWAFEQVDFEPGGKDHSSEGGSYTTAKEIVELFNWKAPIYLQYDFVSVKGMGGKMSSSKGNLITVSDILEVYEPQMVRWIFASYKSNTDFSVSFDLDVIKMYEDFDRLERQVYGVEVASEKKLSMARRVYELSQIDENIDAHTLNKEDMPIQPSFRHLCNLLQINNGDINKTQESYGNEIKNKNDQKRFYERAKRAWFWIENYAPDDFKFSLNDTAPANIEMTDTQKTFVVNLVMTLENELTTYQNDKELHEKIYELINAQQVEPMVAFTLLYRILIGKDKGPKLAGFIRTIADVMGTDKLTRPLKSVL